MTLVRALVLAFTLAASGAYAQSRVTATDEHAEDRVIRFTENLPQIR
ncbi:MAG: hypothetical protein ACKVQA_22445 [Burkholderiales bacterium]